MPLQATSGAASYDAFGGGVAAVPNYIEDVFSTWLYDGTGAAQTINNGIDLAGKGGLVWIKTRSNIYSHVLSDTARGATQWLNSASTDASVFRSNYVTAFNSNGFSVGNSSDTSPNFNTMASWTFRKQPKFFDVVTYTGNNVAGRQIAHNLGSAPGCIIVKNTNVARDWAVWHRSLADGTYLKLNTTDSVITNTSFQVFGDASGQTSTYFTVGKTGSGVNGLTNANTAGDEYVAYLFAHNAGGFGLTGTDNVISCGSFTGNTTVELGYEPQWVLVKNAGGADSWTIMDNMRGMPVTGYSQALLRPNTSGAEGSGAGVFPTATGFTTTAYSGLDCIYIAIRRGPMKVPTTGTSVFSPVSATPSGATTVTTNFPVDLAINAQRDSGTSGNKVFWDRLRGSSTAAGQGLFSNLTNAEVSYSGNGIGLQSNTTIVDNFWNTLNGATTPVIYWNFRRAPGFFDEVCYTGTGSARTVAHNLAAVPELMIVKSRSTAYGWTVYAAGVGNTSFAYLNEPDAFQTNGTAWNNTSPTSSVFTVGTGPIINASGSTFAAYLFASCPGVSKVFNYTGNGSSQTINCGFTGGARFVMIKRTDSTGDWYVWDSARGIVSGNDPRLSLNTTAAEVTTDDSVDTDSTGFVVNQLSATNINVSSATYIGIAIA